MKKAIIPLLLLGSCTPKFIPNKAVQVELSAYIRGKNYRTLLFLKQDTTTYYYTDLS